MPAAKPQSSTLIPTYVNLTYRLALFDVDFRFVLEAMVKQIHREYSKELENISGNECILLISRTRKRGYFITGDSLRATHPNPAFTTDYTTRAFWAVAFHCPSGFEWSNIGKYANELGIDFDGANFFTTLVTCIENGITDAQTLRLKTTKKNVKPTIPPLSRKLASKSASNHRRPSKPTKTVRKSS